MEFGMPPLSAVGVFFLLSFWLRPSVTEATNFSTVLSTMIQPSPSLSTNGSQEERPRTASVDEVATVSGTDESRNTIGLLLVLQPDIKDLYSLIEELGGKILNEIDTTDSQPIDVNITKTFSKLIDKGRDILQKNKDTGNSSVNIFNVTERLVLMIVRYDCLSEEKARLPNRSDEYIAHAIDKFSDDIELTFACPRIVKNATYQDAPNSRKRREVEIEVTLDLAGAQNGDDEFQDFQLLYHNTRFRRNAQAHGCAEQAGCDFKRFETNLTVTNRIFNDSLRNESTSDYVVLSQLLNNTLQNKIVPPHAKVHEIHSFKFRAAPSNAHVKATFYLDVTISSSISEDDIVRAIRTAIINGSIGVLQVNNDNISSIHRIVVNGNYSVWSNWSKCDAASFRRRRTRQCNNPAPLYGGKCDGPSEEDRQCDCGGNMTVGGNITTPYFPTNYPNDVHCEWLLEAPINESVVVSLEEFHLEKDKKCFYDFVEFFEGNTTNTEYRLKQRLCGQQSAMEVESQGRWLLIVFQADKSENERGFRMSWKTRQTVVKPIEYVEQYVTALTLIYSPVVNKTHFPLGKATTCPVHTPDEECIFDEEVFIISRLITALLDRALPLNHDNRIVVNFEHIMNERLFPKFYTGQKYCVTWNEKTQLQSTEGWSRRGCIVLRTNLTHTSCACDHDGLFAVVGQEKVAKSKFRLLANTYIGMGISFFILIMAIVHILWKVEIHGGEVMRINMCVAIGIMQCVFLIGAHAKAQQTLCGFLSFAVYFFVLAEFCWLLLHDLRIHGKIKKIFASNINIEIVYVVIGWGLPLLVALIAIGVKIDLKDPNAVCWKAAAGSAMWGYAAPVVIIALFNLAVLIKLLIPTEDVRNNYDYEEMRFRVIKDAIFLAFFGLTCTFAYQVVDKERFLEQYLLSALVVMQALAMFVLGREGRKDFVKHAEEAQPGNGEPVNDDKPHLPDGESELHIYESIEDAKPETDLGEGREKRTRKRNITNRPPEKITVSTLKSLNIYKEGGQYVIEA